MAAVFLVVPQQGTTTTCCKTKICFKSLQRETVGARVAVETVEPTNKLRLSEILEMERKTSVHTHIHKIVHVGVRCLFREIKMFLVFGRRA